MPIVAINNPVKIAKLCDETCGLKIKDFQSLGAYGDPSD